jgi:NADPH:quinone reductase-like Zn-dependent oxidoreductase
VEIVTPRTMRAVLLQAHGGFDRLVVRGDQRCLHQGRQVLVKVAAAGVNNTDINTRIGWYAPDNLVGTADNLAVSTRQDISWAGDVPTFPRIQGADACGRIVSIGDGVDAGRIGERIIVEPVFRDPGDPLARPVASGSKSFDGAFAEYGGFHRDCGGGLRLDRCQAPPDPVLVLGSGEHA